VLTGDRLLLACCRCFCLSLWTLRDLSQKKEGKKEKNQDVQEAKTLAHTLNYMFLIMRHTGKKLW